MGVEFSFDGKMYKQMDGVAMGLLLGPILANIFVGYLESELFLNCTSPLVYLQYMFEYRQESSSFLNYLNNHHKNLNFTKEEHNKSLNFLDVCVQQCWWGTFN